MTVVYIFIQLFINPAGIAWITVILVILGHLDHRLLRDPWVHVPEHVAILFPFWESVGSMQAGVLLFSLARSSGGLPCGRPWCVTVRFVNPVLLGRYPNTRMRFTVLQT